MTSMLYHRGNRAFQDEFGSRRLADRLEQKLSRTVFSDDDKTFIESWVYWYPEAIAARGVAKRLVPTPKEIAWLPFRYF
jgi:hypothetical protein